MAARMKDDVRRDAARSRDFQTHCAQALEETAIDVVPRLRLDTRLRAELARSRRPEARERQAGTGVWVLQQRDAVGGQREHRIVLADLLEQAAPGQLVDVAADFADRCIREETERAEPMMAFRTHLIRRLATQHARDVGRAEALTDAGDARENLARVHDRRRDRLELVEAVVACPAALAALIVAIAEVLGEMAMAAADASRVALHPAHQRAGAVVQLSVALEHHAPPDEIGRG